LTAAGGAADVVGMGAEELALTGIGRAGVAVVARELAADAEAAPVALLAGGAPVAVRAPRAGGERIPPDGARTGGGGVGIDATEEADAAVARAVVAVVAVEISGRRAGAALAVVSGRTGVRVAARAAVRLRLVETSGRRIAGVGRAGRSIRAPRIGRDRLATRRGVARIDGAEDAVVAVLRRVVAGARVADVLAAGVAVALAGGAGEGHVRTALRGAAVLRAGVAIGSARRRRLDRARAGAAVAREDVPVVAGLAGIDRRVPAAEVERRFDGDRRRGIDRRSRVEGRRPAPDLDLVACDTGRAAGGEHRSGRGDGDRAAAQDDRPGEGTRVGADVDRRSEIDGAPVHGDDAAFAATEPFRAQAAEEEGLRAAPDVDEAGSEQAAVGEDRASREAVHVLLRFDVDGSPGGKLSAAGADVLHQIDAPARVDRDRAAERVRAQPVGVQDLVRDDVAPRLDLDVAAAAVDDRAGRLEHVVQDHGAARRQRDRSAAATRVDRHGRAVHPQRGCGLRGDVTVRGDELDAGEAAVATRCVDGLAHVDRGAGDLDRAATARGSRGCVDGRIDRDVAGGVDRDGAAVSAVRGSAAVRDDRAARELDRPGGDGDGACARGRAGVDARAGAFHPEEAGHGDGDVAAAIDQGAGGAQLPSAQRQASGGDREGAPGRLRLESARQRDRAGAEIEPTGVRDVVRPADRAGRRPRGTELARRADHGGSRG